MFVVEPPVVSGLGENLSKQELGGWKIQLAAGSVDEAVDTEEESFAQARRFLSYLPSSIDGLADRASFNDSISRREEVLFSIVPHNPKQVYQMRRIIDAVVDRNSFFERGRFLGAQLLPVSPALTVGR